MKSPTAMSLENNSVILPEHDRLLLQAVCLEGDAAAAAFDALQSSIDLDYLPPGRLVLLPLLYYRLRQSGSEHPWLGRLSGVYRRSWYANQLLLHSLHEILQELTGAGLPCLVTGGAALGRFIHRYQALRPIGSLELVVSTADVDAIIPRLMKLGWRAPASTDRHVRPGYRRWAPGLKLTNPQGRGLDLWWHVLPEIPAPGLDGCLWGRAAPLELDAFRAATLDATGHLMQACLGATRLGPAALADAALLSRDRNVDWECVMQTARRYRAGRKIFQVFELLAGPLAIELPVRLVPPKPKRPARKGSWENSAPWTAHWEGHHQRWQILRRFRRHYSCYRQIAEAQGITPGPKALLSYYLAMRP